MRRVPSIMSRAKGAATGSRSRSRAPRSLLAGPAGRIRPEAASHFQIWRFAWTLGKRTLYRRLSAGAAVCQARHPQESATLHSVYDDDRPCGGLLRRRSAERRRDRASYCAAGLMSASPSLVILYGVSHPGDSFIFSHQMQLKFRLAYAGRRTQDHRRARNLLGSISQPSARYKNGDAFGDRSLTPSSHYRRTCSLSSAMRDRSLAISHRRSTAPD